MRSGSSNASPGCGVSSLTQVQRQTSVAYRQAIEALREHPARGFAQLEQMGVVREVAWADRSRSVAEAWRQAHAHLNAHDQSSSVLVVCATHDDIAQVTAAIRAERAHGGRARRGRCTVDRYVPLHYTLAQKQDPRQFHAGQVLVFHDDTPEVRRHEALEIVRVDPHQLVARTAGGRGARRHGHAGAGVRRVRAAADRDCAARSPPADGESAGARAFASRTGRW